MNKTELAEVMNRTIQEIHDLREAGQNEYAHGYDNAFANFERLAAKLNIDRKKVLLIYMEKHLDGITSAINGHLSQREPVTGRINDAIVYLILLKGMFIEEAHVNADLTPTPQPAILFTGQPQPNPSAKV